MGLSLALVVIGNVSMWRRSVVIPVLACPGEPAGVTGIQRPACSDARGWLDTGDKPRYDSGNPKRQVQTMMIDRDPNLRATR
jgi:hypothetical protein